MCLDLEHHWLFITKRKKTQPNDIYLFMEKGRTHQRPWKSPAKKSKSHRTAHSNSQFQKIQRTEEHVTLYYGNTNSKQPDCGKLYRTKDLIFSVNSLQETKREEEAYRLIEETQKAYQPMAMCGYYLDLNFFSDCKEIAFMKELIIWPMAEYLVMMT